MALRIAEAVLDRQRRSGPFSTVFQLVEVVRRVKNNADGGGQHPARLALQALRIFVNGEMEELQRCLEGLCPLLRPSARCVVVTLRRAEAALVKAFIRLHENAPSSFAAVLSPQRLQELYPLLQTAEPYAVVQSVQPIWPQADDLKGKRGSRAAACQVFHRVARPGGLRAAPPPREYSALYVKPRLMEFRGSG